MDRKQHPRSPNTAGPSSERAENSIPVEAIRTVSDYKDQTQMSLEWTGNKSPVEISSKYTDYTDRTKVSSDWTITQTSHAYVPQEANVDRQSDANVRTTDEYKHTVT